MGTGTENSTTENETSSASQQKEEQSNTGTPVKRPHHDVQVEEFLKDQYHSRSGKDMPKLGEGNDK